MHRTLALGFDDDKQAYLQARCLFRVEGLVYSGVFLGKNHSTVRRPLLDLQNGHCFYCGNSINTNAEVDHFLPWSRCGDDRLHNMVVSHRKCNNSKRDHLAVVVHLVSWWDRLETRSHEIEALGHNLGWPVDSERSLRLARSLYLRVECGTPLWLCPNEFEAAEPERLRSVLQVA